MILIISENRDWPVLTLPCVTIGSWLLIVGLGFLSFAIKGLSLPIHKDNQFVPSIDNTQEVIIKEETTEDQKTTKTILLICLGVIFYFLFCGIDSYFQSQTYTYGLCGPLGLSPGKLNTKMYTAVTFHDKFILKMDHTLTFSFFREINDFLNRKKLTG